MREIFLVIHFLGLAMGLGTSFGFMFLGIAGSKMETAERLKFQLNAMALSRMGIIGLILLIISGGALMTPYWSTLSSFPLLIIKLVLVIVLTILIAIISSIGKKAQKGDTEKMLKKMEPFGKISMLTGLIIVILAVYIFH